MLRKRKPSFYPDQSIYAEYACAEFGLAFEELDGGTGLVFRISSATASRCFGGGRCSFFPQNSATAATLAADKYFTNRILERAGIPSLSGEYFFLHQRHRAYRAPGHERDDAFAYFHKLNGIAFAKPLNGSRGDFAQPVQGSSALADYLDDVAQFYDSVLIQPLVVGNEYRIFLLDDDIVYTARKSPPFVEGDGVHSIRDLLDAGNASLQSRGLSRAMLQDHSAEGLDNILPAGERRELPGRMNRSAGGTMTFGTPPDEQAAFALARRAVRALGLRAAAVDIFTDIGDDPNAMRVIEINANPSIRFLEDNDRADLILQIWRHTLTAIGLLRV
jgi:D-alanine-D-alanine ligase-like ATP-grasp enzyme